MIILDTNVLSALMQQQPDPVVVNWLDAQAAEAIWISSIHFAAQLAAERKNRGRPIDMRDTFIAGIAIAQGAALATRNIRHFDDLPIPVINPWPTST